MRRCGWGHARMPDLGMCAVRVALLWPACAEEPVPRRRAARAAPSPAFFGWNPAPATVTLTAGEAHQLPASLPPSLRQAISTAWAQALTNVSQQDSGCCRPGLH